METIRKYGKKPYRIGLLHGGPGAAGEMKPVAETLSKDAGVLELLQTEKTIDAQVAELHRQLTTARAEFPVLLIGFSWGAWLAIFFARKYPQLVQRLILVSAPAFEPKYNQDLWATRLSRLNAAQQAEAGRLLAAIQAGEEHNGTLERFGRLMAVADAYHYEPGGDNEITIDIDIYKKVWNEAAAFRDSGELAECLKQIKCPVLAIHGEADPHPAAGVEAPLSANLSDFRMVKLQKCGHVPWKEKYARADFYRLLRAELAGV